MTYPASLYAALHCGNPGDLAFYRAACAGAASALELGCGYGRVMAALADVVPDLWGLDSHSGLLAMAKAAVDAQWVEAAMQTFSLGRTFDRILIPYNGLYCLTTDDDVRACLTAVKGHLGPTGRLVFDVYPYVEAPSDEVVETLDEETPIVEIEDADTAYRVFESTVFDPVREVAEVTYRYEPTDGGPSRTGTIAQRALPADRITTLLAAAGLAIVSWAGGFHGEPLDDPEQWLVVAEPAG